MIGGTIAFGGEMLASGVSAKPWLGGLGKLVHSGGVSVQDNVAQDLGMFSRYQVEVGPVTFTIGGKERFFDVSYSIVSTVGIGLALGSGGRFDTTLSLQTLTPIFIHDGVIKEVDDDTQRVGYCMGNTISLSRGVKNYPMMAVLSHEFNHSISWSNFRLAGNVYHLKNWEFGREVLYGIHNLMLLDKTAYWYAPMELEAFTMEKRW
jgi:hypothetical protein